MKIKKDILGTHGGETVERIELIANGGTTIALCTRGATLLDWIVPKRDGDLSSIVLGYDTLETVLSDTAYLGVTVGRVANRIGGSQYREGAQLIRLQANERGNMLHGGRHGFHQKNWKAEIHESSVTFTTHSPDGEEGFPGALDVSVTYTLEEILTKNKPTGCTLLISYEAIANKRTPVALTNHAYFNLDDAPTIYNHTLEVAADAYTPVGEGMIPTGEVRDVGGTAFDLRTAKDLATILKEIPEGVDHNFVLNAGSSGAAILACHNTGRVLRTETTEPGIQVYTGNFLNSEVLTRKGPSVKHGAICLETQRFPDFVNQPNFEGFYASPENTYRSQTKYVISVS